MFEHLDDPAAPEPTARALRAVLARSSRLRRQRIASGFFVVGVVTLIAGLVIGVAASRPPSPSQVFAAFDSSSGPPPFGTSVPLANLADVVFFDDLHGMGLAFHRDHTVLAASDDGGNTWSVVDGALPADLPAQLEFADGEHGYLWGGTPGRGGAVPLWVTADGGRTWRRAPIGPVVSDVSAIGANVWAVVGACPITSLTVPPACPATVDVSVNSGRTWRTTTAAPPVSEDPGLSVADQDLELARISELRAYVLSFAPSQAGTLLGRLGYTADGGRSWVARPDPCPRYFDVGQEIAASGTNDLWMLCASEASSGAQAKALYRSGDGGRHWALAAGANAPVLSGDTDLPAGGGLPVSGYLAPNSLGHENLAVLTPQSAWLFPDRAGVFATTNGGRTWSSVTSLTSSGLVGGGSGNIVFADAHHGWVCEVGAGLWRTSDGVHWQRLGS
jgi:photosystem II stability/assembly factor-like uncharacterized protein